MDFDTITETTRLLVEDWAERIETTAPNRLDVYMKRKEDLIPAVAGLRVKRLGYLAGITGLDPGMESEDFEVLYHFCPGSAIINLRVRVPKTAANVPSLCAIIPSAESFERELSEMFGIIVVGLRNPERLYLPEDWEEGLFPLRKDLDSQTLADRISVQMKAKVV
jgi:Ni,Fe-hydrogenase III component G